MARPSSEEKAIRRRLQEEAAEQRREERRAEVQGGYRPLFPAGGEPCVYCERPATKTGLCVRHEEEFGGDNWCGSVRKPVVAKRAPEPVVVAPVVTAPAAEQVRTRKKAANQEAPATPKVRDRARKGPPLTRSGSRRVSTAAPPEHAPVGEADSATEFHRCGNAETGATSTPVEPSVSVAPVRSPGERIAAETSKRKRRGWRAALEKEPNLFTERPI